MVMRLLVFNVGQGDSILVELPRHGWGLVDCHCAPEQEAPPVLEALERLGIKDLEFICLSHPDYDHFKGMMAVIRYVHGNGGTVKRFWIFGALPAREIHKAYRSALESAILSADAGPGQEVITAEEVKYHTHREREFALLARYLMDRIKQDQRERRKPEEKQDYRRRFWYRRLTGPALVRTYGDLKLYCLAPTSEVIADYESILSAVVANPFCISSRRDRENNCISVVLSIRFGEAVVMLGGDAGRRQWESVLTALKDETVVYPVKADFLKTSHHGSRYGCTGEILEAVVSEQVTVVISADFTANSYGHPLLSNLAEIPPSAD